MERYSKYSLITITIAAASIISIWGCSLILPPFKYSSELCGIAITISIITTLYRLRKGESIYAQCTEEVIRNGTATLINTYGGGVCTPYKLSYDEEAYFMFKNRKVTPKWKVTDIPNYSNATIKSLIITKEEFRERHDKDGSLRRYYIDSVKFKGMEIEIKINKALSDFLLISNTLLTDTKNNITNNDYDAHFKLNMNYSYYYKNTIDSHSQALIALIERTTQLNYQCIECRNNSIKIFTEGTNITQMNIVADIDYALKVIDEINTILTNTGE